MWCINDGFPRRFFFPGFFLTPECYDIPLVHMLVIPSVFGATWTRAVFWVLGMDLVLPLSPPFIPALFWLWGFCVQKCAVERLDRRRGWHCNDYYSTFL